MAMGRLLRALCCLTALAATASLAGAATPASPRPAPIRKLPKLDKSVAVAPRPSAVPSFFRLLPAPRSKLGRRDPFRPDQPMPATPSPQPSIAGLPPPPGQPPAGELPLPPGSLPPAAPPLRPLANLPDPMVAPETPPPAIATVQVRFTGMIMLPGDPPVALIEVTNGQEIHYVSAVRGERILQSYRLLSADFKRIILLRPADNYRLTLVIDQPVTMRP